MLHLHRAERADRLVAALGDLLRAPLDDPFTPEVVAVPAKGVERWLDQRLATVLGAGDDGQGVSANIRFPSPARLVDETFAAAEGTGGREAGWSASTILWPTLEVIDESVAEPWAGVLAAHLGAGTGDHRQGRRWATASMLATLFTSYGAERPQMLVDWVGGTDTDGAGQKLPEHLQWQAELWRRLRSRIGGRSPAERLDGVCARLAADPDLSDLPPRVSLFGPTRLTTEQLAVLRALAAHRDVHLWLPHPSPGMWRWLSSAAHERRREDDLTGQALGNPLLRSLARDTRELQHRLQPLADTDELVGPFDTLKVSKASTESLLERVQDGIRDDEQPTFGAAADSSIQVHACHGAARQVEVLREALLHAFADDPSLEPRDVLVMCPDVETYAPLIRASFGQGAAAGPDSHPGHRLRVRLADRSLRQTNPLLDTVTTLLTLAGERVTAGQVLDLAATAPVRRRFGLDDDDLAKIREWVAKSGVRWGISAQQRAAFGLGGVRQNTWNTGLDRLLLGVATDESDLGFLGTALPLDDVDSTSVDLAGRLAELVDRLWSVLAGLQGPQPAAAWTAQLTRGLELLTEVRERDGWQLAQALIELTAATQDAGPRDLRRPDVRAMLAELLAGRPTRANFRTGELTVCSMVAMRSVPHRVVALLGLDDDVFPRGAGVDGDDVLALSPCVGERDRRSEDRQLLLDAVMSCSERFIVLYTGADPVSGATRPPAVPLGELLDVVAQVCGADIVRRHALQPFAPRNVDAAQPFSFDPAALRGARAAVSAKTPDPRLLTGPLPALPAGDVDLDDLLDFAQHPVRAFLRQRLGIRVPDEEDDALDRLRVELDGLARWDIGERMLSARLRGVPAAAFCEAELRRGTLPPLRLGTALLAGLETGVEQLAQACRPVHTGPPSSVDVDVLVDGRRLIGTVTGIHGDVLAASSYSSLAPKHRMAAWVRLLAVAAAQPHRGWQVVTTGRGPNRRPTARSTLRPPPDPIGVLRGLIELRDRGLREPLPLTPSASCEYADRRHRGASVAEALEGAAQKWGGDFGDAHDRHLAYVHGKGTALDVLLSAAAPTAWGSSEPSRFGTLARALWTPLLEREQVGPA